jgi:hypothetical protein
MKKGLEDHQSQEGSNHKKCREKNGPKLSKHGIIMHCSYCGDEGHNRASCKLRKEGLNPKLPTEMYGRTTDLTNEEEVQVVTDEMVYDDPFCSQVSS